MDWTKSSAELVNLFSELAPKDPRVQQKKMFGWPCCFVNGNLFTGLHKQNIIFRLPKNDRVAFLELGDTGDFEPMPGHKMTGYMVMAEPLNRNRADLVHWMQRSLAYTRALPAKAKKNAPAKNGKNVKR